MKLTGKNRRRSAAGAGAERSVGDPDSACSLRVFLLAKSGKSRWLWSQGMNRLDRGGLIRRVERATRWGAEGSVGA
jgi:hypothetical protein